MSDKSDDLVSDTPRVEAVVGTGRMLNPATDFPKLACTYSDLLQLARQLERELGEARRKGMEERVAELDGMTMTDVRVLRNANTEFAAENQRLRQALRFYAHGEHWVTNEPHAWDTVSGEPPNFYCDEACTATVEDGTLAKMALQGTPINWDGDEPEPVEGEAEYEIAALAALPKEER